MNDELWADLNKWMNWRQQAHRSKWVQDDVIGDMLTDLGDTLIKLGLL